MNVLRLLTICLGCGLYYAAMRYFSASEYLWYLVGGGLILVAGSLGITYLYVKTKRSKGLANEAQSYIYTLIWQGLVFFSLVVYIFYFLLTQDSPRIDTLGKKLLLGAWLLPLIIGLITAVGMELNVRASGSGRFGEPRRVLKSGLTWSLAGILLVILLNINYIAVEHNHVSDWSYLKVTSLSPTSRNMLLDFEKNLDVYAFFTKDNEVYPFVNEYLESLADASPMVTTHVVDKDLSPVLAEKFRVHKNGNIVFALPDEENTDDKDKKTKYEKIYIGAELRIARKKLRSMDSHFQKAFLSLISDPKKVYFSRGHGEFTWDYQKDPRRALRFLRAFFKKQNYRLRELGLDKGSGREIPTDASVVVVAGPTESFLKEEVEALKVYLESGGKVFIFLDLEKSTGLPELEPVASPLLAFLQEIGLQFKAQVLANDRNYVVVTKSPTDRWFLVTNNFTSHEAVSTLADYDEKVALLFYQSGYFDVTGGNAGWQAQAIVKTIPGTFIDTNRNFTFDKNNEKRSTFVTCAAAEWQGKGGRVFSCADATVISDMLMQNPGNRLFFADGLRWLMNEKHGGADSSEKDIKIMHSRNEDLVLFYGTILCMPLLVLFAGFLATGRRRARRSE